MGVVLDQAVNARAAASIACFVSSRPISGTVPSSSSVAGSARPCSAAPASRAHGREKEKQQYALRTLMVAPLLASSHWPSMKACVRTSEASLRPNWSGRRA